MTDHNQTTTSPRPYLLRAWHEWCTDNNLTPYLAVQVDETVQVPAAFVEDGQIMLNAGYDATSGLHMGNDYISFKARFGGKPHEIMLPVGRVVAIFARETNQGMSFPPENPPEPQAATGPQTVAPRVVAPQPKPAVQLVHSKDDAEQALEDWEDAQADEDAEDNKPDDTPPARPKRPALKRVK